MAWVKSPHVRDRHLYMVGSRVVAEADTATLMFAPPHELNMWIGERIAEQCTSQEIANAIAPHEART